MRPARASGPVREWCGGFRAGACVRSGVTVSRCGIAGGSMRGGDCRCPPPGSRRRCGRGWLMKRDRKGANRPRRAARGIWGHVKCPGRPSGAAEPTRPRHGRGRKDNGRAPARRHGQAGAVSDRVATSDRHEIARNQRDRPDLRFGGTERRARIRLRPGSDGTGGARQPY